jgi:hypothetical protein
MLDDWSSAAHRTYRIVVIGELPVEVGGGSTDEPLGYLIVRVPVQTVSDELEVSPVSTIRFLLHLSEPASILTAGCSFPSAGRCLA